MSRRKKKNMRKSKPRPRRFDVRMIRDFLELLHLELRIKLLENTNPGILNPELVEQMGRYYRRYHCRPLLPMTRLDTQGVSRKGAERSLQIVRKLQISRDSGAVEALETLDKCFETAFEALKCPNEVRVISAKAADILRSYEAEFPHGAGFLDDDQDGSDTDD